MLTTRTLLICVFTQMLINRAEKELAWCDCLRQIFTLFLLVISNFVEACCKRCLCRFESFFLCFQIVHHRFIFSSGKSTFREHLLLFILHPFFLFWVFEGKGCCVAAVTFTIDDSVALSITALTIHLALAPRSIAQPGLEVLHGGVRATF